jgi:hypothetical protein
MVTNKGIFMAALVIGLCIIVASIINSVGTVKAAMIGKKMAGMHGQMGGERGCPMMGGERGDRREGMRGGCGERGERGDRREGMRGRREGMQGCPMMGGERGGQREGMRGNRGERGGRRGSRGQHGGGGSEAAPCQVQEEACTGNGYLFN